MYYGLKRGTQTYRFVPDYVFSVAGLTGNTGDSYELYSVEQTANYIAAIAVQINPAQLRIIIQGDYVVNVNDFKLVNMRTGATINITLSNAITLQEASYLGSFNAVENKEKQITVLNDLASGRKNVVFASIDYNSDGVYNWIIIGNYVDGKDGHSIFGLTANTAASVFSVAKEEDLLISGEDFTYEGHDYKIGDLDLIVSLNSITLESKGNIRGATGLQGTPGTPGTPGKDGVTPVIRNNYWWIGDTNTGVKAIGIDGKNGEDGQTFSIQSDLYSVPANVGKPNNLDPEGNALTALPTLPQTNISGKGYVVYDPITTPLEPYYDLYWANNGDTAWTIVHPFSGIKGKDGKDGYTPYIKNNMWYINGVSTGVQATGDTGATGAKGDTGDTALTYDGRFMLDPYYTVTAEATLTLFNRTPKVGETFLAITLHSSSEGASTTVSTICLFIIKSIGETVATVESGQWIPVKGDKGDPGATPNISVNAEALPAGSAPTASRTGTNENPIITFGIPKGADYVELDKLGDLTKEQSEALKSLKNYILYNDRFYYLTTVVSQLSPKERTYTSFDATIEDDGSITVTVYFIITDLSTWKHYLKHIVTGA